MRDAVAARLGYDPFVEHAADSLVIVFDKQHRELSARIELDRSPNPKGTRTLTSSDPTCTELAAAASLAVALALDPLRVARQSAPDVEKKAEAPPAAIPAAPVAQEIETGKTEKAPTPHAAPFIGAGGFVAAGIVPSVSAGPRVRFGLSWPAFAVSLDGLWIAPTSADSPSGRVDVSVFAGGLTPCVRVPLNASFVAEACGRALVGGLFGEASRVGTSTPTTTVYVAAGAEVVVELAATPRIGLRVSLGGLASVTRTFLRIREGARDVDVWRSPAFSSGAGLEAVVHFP